MLRVFLVEDETIVSTSLGTLLKLETEIKVVGVAESTEQALRELGNIEVDDVLMDISSLGMDGIEATCMI